MVLSKQVVDSMVLSKQVVDSMVFSKQVVDNVDVEETNAIPILNRAE